MAKKGRVFSGARPTGRQHLGNYLGAIKNYVALQDDYDCIYCIVDIHALTTVETTADLKDNTYEMALDWLAAVISPDESIVFIQSHVPQVMELHTLLSMGVTGIVELAPGGVLTGLAKRTMKGVPSVALKTPDDLEAARELSRSVA